MRDPINNLRFSLPNLCQQSLTKCFPEYDGPEGEAMPALRFIEQKYKQVFNNQRALVQRGKSTLRVSVLDASTFAWEILSGYDNYR